MSMLIAKFSFATLLKLQLSHEIIYLCLLGHLFPYAGNGYVNQDGDLIQCAIPMTHHFLQSVCVKVEGRNAKLNTFALGKSTYFICLKAKNYYNPSSLCQGNIQRTYWQEQEEVSKISGILYTATYNTDNKEYKWLSH